MLHQDTRGSTDPASPVQHEQLHCPHCGSRDARRSQSRRLFDGIARTFGLKPYRCRSCRSRFFTRDDPER